MASVRSCWGSYTLRGTPIDPAVQWPASVTHIAGWNGMSDRRRLRVLREVAEESSRDPRFRSFVVHEVLAGVPDRAYAQQAAAMLRWVQQRIRYINEPDEQIQTPWRTIKNGFGDCDDMAVLLAAMANAVGLPWRFVLGGRRNGRPVRWVEGTPAPWFASFYHIYLMFGWPIGRPTTWVSAEPTVKSAPLGYDVVMASAGGAAALPELAGFAGYGDPTGRYSSAIDAPESAIAPIGARVAASLRDPETWVEVTIGVLQSVIIGLIVDRAIRSKP